MRKFGLTTIVTVAFVSYVLFQRHTSPKISAIAAPLSLNQTSNVSSLPSTVATNPQSANPSSQQPPQQQQQPATKPTQIQQPPRQQPPQQQQPPRQQTPPPPKKPAGQYADGEYVGQTVDAYYGYVQVKAIIQGGKIADVQFLQYPNDRGTSREINSQAMPYLTAEAIQAQSANVDIVSGATDTSQAFQQSLATALAQAKN